MILLSVFLLVLGLPHIAATSNERQLCLYPATTRTQIVVRILRKEPNHGRKLGGLLSRLRPRDAKACWQSGQIESASRRLSTNSREGSSDQPVLIPDVFELIAPSSSQTEGSGRVNNIASLQDEHASSPHHMKYKLVLRPDSVLLTLMLARKINALGRYHFRISQTLSDLLETLSIAAQTTSKESFLPFPLEETNSSSCASYKAEMDENSLNKLVDDMERETVSNHPDDHSDVLGCLQPNATAHSGVDLSGRWRPIVTKDFLKSYDIFLQACGESYWMRKLLTNAVSMQLQHIRQLDEGRRLEVVDVHPMASWNRSLVTSGKEEIIVNHLIDPQGDALEVVACWCDDGTVHKSLLKSRKPHLHGAWLESNRKLEFTDRHTDSPVPILVAEAIFHPPPSDQFSPTNLRHASLVWRYELLQ